MNANPNSPKKRKKLNAIDYFIIAAVLLCIVGVTLRSFIGSEGNHLSSPIVMEDYVISFKISNIRNSSSDYFAPGEKFYIDSTKQYFGEIADTVSVTPALLSLEDINGQYIQTYAPENGDATRMDIAGTMLVSGYMGENGFLLGGSTNLALNKEMAIRSSYIYATIVITDIAKAS